MESTYGGRLHKDVEPRGQQAGRRGQPHGAARGGRIIVPAFAVGRTQQLVLLLHQLANEKRIPNIPIFVDSPLARERDRRCTATTPSASTRRRARYLLNGEDPFGFKRLQYVREAAESKKLNDLHGPFVVISASGMCEQGRILHHLRNNIEDPRNTVLITGFQAQDTLGRKLVEKWPEVRIFGEPMRVQGGDLEPRRVERPCRPAASFWSGSGRWRQACERCSWCMASRSRRRPYARLLHSELRAGGGHPFTWRGVRSWLSETERDASAPSILEGSTQY